jgi:hypothetical protein
LYSAFIESRIHSRNGHLPLVTRVKPTKVGERVSVRCPAGVSIVDFEQREAMLAAACYARSARVSVDKARTHRVTVEIVRRDTLAQDERVVPTLLDRLPDPTRVPVDITPDQVVNR